MVLFSWNNIYLTNIKECDDQHKKLITLINELHEKMKDGNGEESLERILSELLDYTAYHFLTEESLFDAYGYPETDIHKKEHADLTSKTKDFYDRFTKGEKFISIQLSTFLKNWFIDHTLTSDKKYGQFLNSMGVQ